MEWSAATKSQILTCLGVAASPMARAVATVAIADSIASLVDKDVHSNIVRFLDSFFINIAGSPSSDYLWPMKLLNLVVKLVNLMILENPAKLVILIKLESLVNKSNQQN